MFLILQNIAFTVQQQTVKFLFNARLLILEVLVKILHDFQKMFEQILQKSMHLISRNST